MSGARFLGRIDAINGSKGAMEGKGAGEIKFFFWLCLHKRIRTVELAATTTWTAGWLCMHFLRPACGDNQPFAAGLSAQHSAGRSGF